MAASGDLDVYTRPRSYLSISGGGANGAFGVGLLNGWSESGARPEFFIVTGISTGALIAPYAFLGSDYDDELVGLYTTLTTKDLIKKRSLISGITSDALYDTQPMRELLKKFVDDKMIARIAEEHSKGRRLVIGTTNLDAERPVIWNIGAIAAVGTEDSAQLIRDVMLASASIPGMFPPVRITVRVGDQEYDELHVDGGVSSQVFLYPAQINLRDAADLVGVSQDQSVYVIRNGLRFWKHEELDQLFAKRRKSLQEVEQLVADARQKVASGKVGGEHRYQLMVSQGPALLERVAEAHAFYSDLEKTAATERGFRREAK